MAPTATEEPRCWLPPSRQKIRRKPLPKEGQECTLKGLVVGQRLLRACQPQPKQLPLPQQRQRLVLGRLTAPGTLLHLLQAVKATATEAEGFS